MRIDADIGRREVEAQGSRKDCDLLQVKVKKDTRSKKANMFFAEEEYDLWRWL